MPLCFVDFNRSPTFAASLTLLRKQFPNIDRDLEQIWPDIARDYRKARQAESIPKFKDTVFKYRSKCSDMKRGASGGYRVIGFYHQPNNTLYPIFVYHKAENSDVQPKTVAACIQELLNLILDSK